MSKTHLYIAAFFCAALAPVSALAQTGVDDDRVSLPEGPGSLEGVGDNAQVSGNMGGMTTSVSIPTPMGRGGMQPDLNLSYHSSAGVSLLGVGWSMQTPSIERMSSRGVPRYGQEDLFAANGSGELVWVGEQDGGATQVYRERYEGSFTRYLWHEVGDGSQGYWEAQRPDGTREFYGADSQGAMSNSARAGDQELGTAKYQLVERIDPFGNRVRYEYTLEDSNVPLIARIAYVFVDDEPRYSVEMGYEKRPDPISDAGMGYEEVLTQRLKGLIIRHQDEIVREVAIGYEAIEGSSLMSRLSSVEQWGVGGKEVGLKDPVHYTFSYQRGLGVSCEGACDKPYLTSMGTVPGGVSLNSGLATLIDINGDALPDVLGTNPDGNHRFFLNTMNHDGTSYTQSFSSGQTSQYGTSSFTLGERTQVLDVNGDGYADLVNMDSGSFLLKDPDADDWMANVGALDTDKLRTIDFGNARFFDYDNDKKIDVLVSVGGTTQVLANRNGVYDYVGDVDPIGMGFADANLQLSDLNGDGMNDVVELKDGAVSYRINLGLGRWTEWRQMLGTAPDAIDLPLTELEDLNGDGRDDLVVVSGDTVRYALNRVDRFDGWVTLNLDSLGFALPERTDGVRVLYTDMNANGSEDIVWFKADGQVEFLELFPERANLLSETHNGLGRREKVRYGTSVQHMVRAEADSAEWSKPLQMPMPVVDELEVWVDISQDLREVQRFDYRDGFYNGEEKQFRGFKQVTKTTPADAAQQEFMIQSLYDVGDQDDAFHGRMMSQEVRTDAALIRRTAQTHERCDISQVPSAAELLDLGRKEVSFVCMTRQDEQVFEGKSEAEAITLSTLMSYDGYGNLIKQEQLGDVAVEGDEMTTEREFSEPRGSLWRTDLLLSESMYVEASGDRTQMLYYYDGGAFEGLPHGEYTRGFLSRATTRADADHVIETSRQASDEYGNVIATLDPNASSPDEGAHRRDYTMGPYDLFVARTQMQAGEGKTLVRESTYDLTHQKVSQMSDWILMDGEQESSGRRISRVDYDGLGRFIESYEPDDQPDRPSQQIIYDMNSELSSITMRVRTEQDEMIETVSCFDGRGRRYQNRVKLDDGAGYQVDGYSIFNSRGALVERFDAHISSQRACQLSPPSSVPSMKYLYDALYRELAVTFEDGVSMLRYSYEPLKTFSYDENDNDEDSPFFDTPSIMTEDGLGRAVMFERTGLEEPVRYQLHYDNTGSFTGYTDPAGLRHEMSVDLAGRITQVTNPNFGTLTMSYDDAGNMLTSRDARGTTTRQSFDALNRLVARWQEGEAESRTRVTWLYDTLSDCTQNRCDKLAGRLAGAEYTLELEEDELVSGGVRYDYDERGRTVHIERSWDGLVLPTELEFDLYSRQTGRAHADGTRYDVAYDSMDRVVRVKELIDEVTYQEQGLLEQVAWTNGSSSLRSYDVRRRLETLRHDRFDGEPIAAMRYERDAAGNLMAILDEAGRQDVPSSAMSFEHDALDRVIKAVMGSSNNQSEELSYTWDARDRLMALTSSLGEQSRSHVGMIQYDAIQQNAVTLATERAYEHDEAGHMTRSGELQMSYDHRGRMEQVGQARYIYGELQQPVMRVGDDELALYADEHFEVRDGISQSWFKLQGERVATQSSAALQTRIYPDMDEDAQITAADAYASSLDQEDAAQRAGLSAAASPRRILAAAAARLLHESIESRRALHTDHLTSIIAETDAGGEVVGERAYSPTGLVRWETGDMGVYGFTGQEHTGEGHVRFMYRHLDPRVGRWTSFDPMFMELGASDMDTFGEATTGYAYVAGRMSGAIDPLGLVIGKGGDKLAVPTQKRGPNQSARMSALNTSGSSSKSANTSSKGDAQGSGDAKSSSAPSKKSSSGATISFGPKTGTAKSRREKRNKRNEHTPKYTFDDFRRSSVFAHNAQKVIELRRTGNIPANQPKGFWNGVKRNKWEIGMITTIVAIVSVAIADYAGAFD